MDRRPESRWPAIKNGVLLAILVVEYLGVAWCALAYLPGVEARYREQLGPVEVPIESDRVFAISRALDGRWPLAIVPLAALVAVGSLAFRTRRWALFDGLYFVGIVLLALLFLFCYLSLAVPLVGAPR